MLMQISGISIWLLARVIRAISNKAVAQLSHDKAKCEFILLWKEVEVTFFQCSIKDGLSKPMFSL